MAEIETIAADLRAKSDSLVAIGIGGSYLGARAVIEALAPAGAPSVHFAGQNLSARYHADLLKSLEGKRVAVNVISKSGTTTEPAVAFRLFRESRVPMVLKAVPLLALLYVISPVDFVPDFIPGLGQLDDLGIIIAALELFVRLCPSVAQSFHQEAINLRRRYSPMTPTDEIIEAADDASFKKQADNIAHVSVHNAYHTGQIIYIRKQQGSWDPEKGVK